MATRYSQATVPTAHVSLGSYGRMPFRQAISEMLIHPPEDPLLGALSSHHVQLCPQNTGRLDREAATDLWRNFPGITWRVHANVRVEETLRIVDLCDWPQEGTYFRQVAQVSATLKAPAYTAHAGRRTQASLAEVLRYTQEVEQLFGVPVGIEGHYPAPGNPWLISSWGEYRQLLESGVRYALDLSHLHILAVQSGRQERSLVQELLASDRCLEVHVSANDGTADQHLPLTEAPWWWPLLAATHPDAVLFCEGRQARLSMVVTA